jgi:hypothetical protein|tara:strand:- start:237 stop:449 length:213 start_codon:yes stop_codon:yes gene_type:complete
MREKGKKWDGKSRVSNAEYKKNWNTIFGKKDQKEVEEKLWHNLKEWNLKKKEPKTRMEQMEQLEHDPIID